ncbi:MAG TPA: MmgE/PrpD family protein [Burkholderiales bacterium]|nr:MmgE/PrpD family protein [Burkholderiales bacterium]
MAQQNPVVAGATETLARYAAELTWETLPEAVVAEAKRAILDFHGAAIAGSRDAVVDKLLAVYAARAGAPEASLVGRERKADVLSAALINGAAGHALDFDDTHADFFYHGTVPVAPVVWALGESLGASGRELLTAFVAGWEVGARIGRAVYPHLYHKGWQGTATVGTFAAAVAAGKLLKLDVHGMRNAIGLAASQAGGTRQMLGTMSKPFQCGKAGMNGLLGALLSREGLTSSLVALEAPLGFAALTSPSYDLEKAVGDPGTRWELLRNTYKPYSCCLKHHATVDAFLALRRTHDVTPEHLRSATCVVYPAVLDTANVDEPRTGPEGKFSVQHSAAVALTDNRAALAQYSDERVRDPKLAVLRRKLRFIPDAAVRPDQCEVTAETTDGTTIKVRVEEALGGIGRPLSDADLEAKFRDIASPVADAARQDRLLSAFRALERVADVRSVTADW